MKTFIENWGHSLAVRLPKQVLRRARLSAGDELEVEVTARGVIFLAPSRRRLRNTLEQISPKNVHDEAFAGAPLGNEVW